MSFNLSSDYNAYIDSLFETNDEQLIRDANAYLLSGSTKVTGSAITLDVRDAENTQRYFLTSNSSPAILLDSGSLVYYVDEIDVAGFPDGDISLIWSITHDSTDYVLTSSVSFESAPPVTIVQGETATLQDFAVNIDTPKVFNIKIMDAAGIPYDGYQARLKTYDSDNGNIVETVNATLQATGSGYWSVSHTLTNTNYNASLNRYEIFWEIQSTSGGPFVEVAQSRYKLQLYGSNPLNVTAGGLTFSTNQDLMTNIVGLAELISPNLRSAGELSIVLNNKRQQAANQIRGWLNQNPGANRQRDLLRDLEINMVWRNVLINSMAFSKMSSTGLMLREIDKQIKSLKLSVFGPFATLRILPT